MISGIQSHVKRILKNGDPSTFIDVERIDFFVLETGNGPDYQRFGVTLTWLDEGVTDGSSGNTSRAMTLGRVIIGGDPSVYVDVPILDFYATSESGQLTGATLNNDPTGNQDRGWTGDGGDAVLWVNSGITNVEARLNAGENVPSSEYQITSYSGDPSLRVDYLAFFATLIEGQTIGNLLPLTDLVKSLDHTRKP